MKQRQYTHMTGEVEQSRTNQSAAADLEQIAEEAHE